MSTPTEDQRRMWIAQWRSAAISLARVRLEEFRGADLSRIAADLEDACAASAGERARRATSGLVEQQRLLHRRAIS